MNEDSSLENFYEDGKNLAKGNPIKQTEYSPNEKRAAWFFSEFHPKPSKPAEDMIFDPLYN